MRVSFMDGNVHILPNAIHQRVRFESIKTNLIFFTSIIMASDSLHKVDESTGTVDIVVPAGIEVQVSVTFLQTYRQIISETWLSGGLLKKEEFYASDHPEKSGDSTTPCEAIARQLTLRFLYFIDGRQRPIPSEMLEVITESQEADSLTLLIFARDESSSRPTDSSDSDMFARVTLYDPSSPAVEHGLGGATTVPESGDEGTTSNAEEPQYVTPDLSNIQAKIVPGLNKAYQYFIFFRFNKLSGFRDTMKSEIIPVISTAKDVFDMLKKKEFPSSGLPNTDWEYVGCSVGFSSIGLSKLGLNDYLYDEAFHRGQKQDAKDLGDKGTESEGEFLPDWEDKYLEEIHGVFQITAHNDSKGKAFAYQLKQAFSYSKGIKTVLSFQTQFRPHPDTPNEHFGFRDGISKPEIEGYTFDDELPIRFPGCLLMGRKGDLDKDRRPAWAFDGSFFVFRKLRQLVPEFNSFLQENGVKLFPSSTPENAADKLGARVFGRWKSGTPVVLSPDEDDKSISQDNNQINNFQYPADQNACPFAAHTQKSYPRTNMPGSNDHLFRRSSIPYGDELDASEISTSTTQKDRGLLFLCYQSSIERGFKYTQQRFNNPDFPFSPLQSEKPGQKPGYDAVIGSSPRYMTGANPEKPTDKLSIPLRFVEARGGEYFFMPSISTLNMIAP
ncbi:hypothetical protein D9757_011219 [Collybiopsis confluens]|uniref:Dyp-type peroxidase n=1 Tax=Collybiopsis confluens TaxID=2823264 RepID=A0A8H5GND2_9AGAR|nr:hypothetical protein D9757_011219 [Collybiopsis confluens]